MPFCSLRYILTLLFTLLLAPSAIGIEFRVALAPELTSEPITGRLFVFLTRRTTGEPRFGPNWFQPEPFFGQDVKEFAPGTSQVMNDTAVGFPDVLSKIPAGKYRAQALLDHDFYEPSPALGVGNFYSDVMELNVSEGDPTSIALVLNKKVEAEPFPDLPRFREVVIESRLLGDFHHRPVQERAVVVLPPSYETSPERRYPVLYVVPGFGGGHRDLGRQLLRTSERKAAAQSAASGTTSDSADSGKAAAASLSTDDVEFIYVALSGRCKWGHHVYADSATNGPRGQALVEELIPKIDAEFRTIAAPTARFVSGHSSGGWSSLWLQVNYPETFGGVWSTAPDPVDFRDYQQVDLYADPPLSLYFDLENNRRPIARRGTEPVLWYESFGKMDDVLGRGGQLRSFEAVFSPRGEDGLPVRLWDRQSGKIDPQVAKAWEPYDIRLVLERNWVLLGPKLAGKLHITTGELDTFYLEGAVRLLSESLQKLGSDAKIEIVPGKNHGDLLTADLRRQMHEEMVTSFLKHHAN